MSNEKMWAEDFGNQYTDRNDKDYSPRGDFFGAIMSESSIQSVLEVGCNTGMNLEIIRQWLPINSAWGCDVNQYAIQELHNRHPQIQAVVASGFDIPFRDNYFDLVFTSGVLIHQKPTEVESVMQEIIRVSKKYVMAIEYYNEIFEEIPYRDHPGALFKGPFGDVYEKRYGLKLIECGKVDKEDGFDNCSFWLLEK
jgi:pseudaminic acid biosynthesis-associated methylase